MYEYIHYIEIRITFATTVFMCIGITSTILRMVIAFKIEVDHFIVMENMDILFIHIHLWTYGICQITFLRQESVVTCEHNTGRGSAFVISCN